MRMVKAILVGVIAAMTSGAVAQYAQEDFTNHNKFRQLKQELATPNVYRTASGAPGHEYYQNKADYVMDIILDDTKQTITGKETVTYRNNSPDELRYLWLQLDQNVRAQDSDTKLIRTGTLGDDMNIDKLMRLHSTFDGGFKIQSVTDASGKALTTMTNKTMMRINLPKPLAAGGSYTFKISWWYNVNDRATDGGRSGYEYLPENDNYLYTIAQFFPRMCVYNEVEGWQNKQFLGNGEFTLPFGDYKVSLTVPSDHMVGSTGVLQNPKDVLSNKQIKRLAEAKESEDPIMIVTPEEALKNEKSREKGMTTWVFHAKNVRDFGWASSRTFIWDACAVKLPTKNVMAMSYYPKEGNPLWGQYSTKVVAHTIKVYSKYTIDYPYPVAISVHTKNIGMEYPMICFNGGRPEADGTYAERTKYGMIGVIIHEVGHNFFPMIINSDERQWTWMDEGLNTFTQYLCEQEWERGYPSKRGPAYKITDYMKGDRENISPIMTNSESLHQFGNNAYGKPAAALNILRETIMGRELFDHAFKEYARRWAFKHPTPADFFRTMEDASGVDLDWFWRGWFYTTEHVDVSLEAIKWYKLDSGDPEWKDEFDEVEEVDRREHIGIARNHADIKETYAERDTTLYDFYNRFDPIAATIIEEEQYAEYKGNLTTEELAMLDADWNYYQLDFKNVGGLVSPIILEFTFQDDTKQIVRIPAEIWMSNNAEVSKVFFFQKELKNVWIDPFLEMADCDEFNNGLPRMVKPSKFAVFKQKKYRWGANGDENPMQKARRMEDMPDGDR